MTVKVWGIGLKGLEGYRVQVEVQAIFGMGSMVIVGLPDASVKESKERVLSAIRTLGKDVLSKKIVVNLSPADQKKNGAIFDLAIAVGLLKEFGQIKYELPRDAAFIGALSLDGEIVKVEGILAALISARKLGFKQVFLPYDPMLPIDMLEELDCIVVHHMNDVLDFLSGKVGVSISSGMNVAPEPEYRFERDFSQIVGHEYAKQALEVAAAGRHNVFMSGPPGCGKSMLAEALPSILPPLTKSAQLEVISLYQLSQEQNDFPYIAPYRSPHHSASSIALIGGGSYPKPGEISLAHHGVLFLDEIAEFSKKTLDMLRQPLERGKVTISRTHSTVTYPASFLLIAAMNPCPCGYFGSKSHYCTCSRKQIQAYRNRISGPVYDRIDILLSIERVDFGQQKSGMESSVSIRDRVQKAQLAQFNRYQQEIYNGTVSFELLTDVSPLTERQKHLVSKMSSKHHWSNRVQTKVIRLARTLSDLAGEVRISDESIWEAMGLREKALLRHQKNGWGS